MLLQLLNNVGLVWIKCLTVNISIMATIKIKQVRSSIKRPAIQKATMQALGLKKMNQVIEHEATPQMLGMVKKVQHLLEVVE
jgi:large subunit ribosomal protein L30